MCTGPPVWFEEQAGTAGRVAGEHTGGANLRPRRPDLPILTELGEKLRRFGACADEIVEALSEKDRGDYCVAGAGVESGVEMSDTPPPDLPLGGNLPFLRDTPQVINPVADSRERDLGGVGGHRGLRVEVQPVTRRRPWLPAKRL